MDGLRVIVQPGTGYELLISGVLLADPSSPRRIGAARSWRQRAGTHTLAAFERIGREPFVNLMGFVHSMTDQPSAAAAIAAIKVAPAVELHLALVGYFRRAFRIVTPPAVIRSAVDGDPAAITDFKRTSYPYVAHWQRTLGHLLGRPSAEVQEEFGGTLEEWIGRSFGDSEAAIADEQERDAAVVRELAAQNDLDSVLSRIAPGITFARELGQELVVLAPSVLIGPGFALSDYGSVMVIAYPAAGNAEDSAQPPARLVAMTKAMGDELRLRALRELRDGPMTATELAQRLGIPRTTVHHHVSLLVNSGLARMSVDDARTGNIVLREEAVKELSELAERWLLGRKQKE